MWHQRRPRRRRYLGLIIRLKLFHISQVELFDSAMSEPRFTGYYLSGRCGGGESDSRCTRQGPSFPSWRAIVLSARFQSKHRMLFYSLALSDSISNHSPRIQVVLNFLQHPPLSNGGKVGGRSIFIFLVAGKSRCFSIPRLGKKREFRASNL